MASVFGVHRRTNDKARVRRKLLAAAQLFQRRALVEMAAGTIGATFSTDGGDTQYCVNAVAAIVPVVMRRAGCDMQAPVRIDIFAGSLAALACSTHLSEVIGGELGKICPGALVALFSRRVATDELVTLLQTAGACYNEMTAGGTVVPDIEQRFADWLAGPTPEKFEAVVASFLDLRSA